MTETTKEIFSKHEVRKTREQKRLFRNYLTAIATEQGYSVKTEQANKGVHNVIVGDPESADVIYTAHYDTCAIMPLPNFITPKCIPIYVLYQVILTLLIYIIPCFMMSMADYVLLATDSSLLSGLMYFTGFALLLLFTYLMMCGPANKHTANDNTSGVTLLIDIMCELPTELKDKVAFIFFDFEELGMIGSKGYATKHSKVATKIPVINFDCVSDEKNILFAVKKKAKHLEPKLTEAFKSDGNYTVEIATKGVFYPSDQMNFNLGIGVAALKRTKRGLLYMNRIHTKNDTVYDEENIEFLKNGAIEFAKII